MLAILSGCVKLIDWYDERLNAKRGNLMRKDVLYNKEPEKAQLVTITRNKLFKQTPKHFQQAVLTKLATCERVPTALEKTMSPGQLYCSGNPLWTQGLSVKAIERFYDIENQLEDYGAQRKDYIDEYLQDCKNGMTHTEALQKQQRKYGVY
jgi:hypothetical protein